MAKGRIVIDVEPSVDPRKGDNVNFRAEGIDDLFELQVILQAVQGSILQRIGELRTQAMIAQAQQSPVALRVY